MYKRQGEANATYILNYFYENKKEAFTEQEWRHIFSEWYRDIGMSYFGLAMTKEACCCFKRALHYNWKLISKPAFVRIWFAAFIGREQYIKLKSVFSK